MPVPASVCRDSPGLMLQSHGDLVVRRRSVRWLGTEEPRVMPERPTQLVSAEDTFAEGLPQAMLAPHIRRLAEKTWAAACKTERVPRTVVLKLKTRDFRILTRSLTPPQIGRASCRERVCQYV